jgi:hypothetical protein
LGLLTTLSADGREHLLLAAFVPAASTVPTASVTPTAEAGAPRFLAGTPAIGATARFIGKALTGEKVLLACGERELSPTITTGQGLIWHIAPTPYIEKVGNEQSAQLQGR